MPIEEISGELQDVRLALAQGRHVNLHAAQPVEQVRTEQPLGHELLQTAVGGGDNPDIDAMDAVTADDLKKLRSNPTGKVILVNFWATWCGPCLTEFPEIENTYRMFRRRDFDLVTVSTNLPDEKAGVMKTLQAQHATSRNLQFATEDTYGLQAAFDAHWEAGVPYTMVIAPGGKVLYQKQGEVDILEVRRVILANLENETYVGHPGYWAQR